ncbi:hypothetical protein N7492_010717 [Penicillium capsulatum]|uniref:Uncharacterized protein n=1 Tax=Penicillium capsulatum TaxID=69766 RepID=A0A9W9HMB6_9EURO|nr:hypothetical protein N7492_010717 [Penicillium capsulatum]
MIGILNGLARVYIDSAQPLYAAEVLREVVKGIKRRHSTTFKCQSATLSNQVAQDDVHAHHDQQDFLRLRTISLGLDVFDLLTEKKSEDIFEVNEANKFLGECWSVWVQLHVKLAVPKS